MPDYTPPPAFDSDDLTELPVGQPGRLFRGPMPLGAFDGRRSILRRLQEENVQVVVPLIEAGEDVQKAGLDLLALYGQAGYTILHSPIQDFMVPGPGQLEPVIDRVADELAAGRGVFVHCNAGHGRTGIFLAMYAIRKLGMSGTQAVTWVRTYIPVAMENDLQIAFVLSADGGTPTT